MTFLSIVDRELRVAARRPATHRVRLLAAMAVIFVVLLLDFRALSWTGMFMAMRSKSHSRAVLSTVGRVLLPPWAGIFAFALFGMAGRGLSSGTVETFVLLWLGAGAINSLALASNSRSWLLDEFRTLAANVRIERLEPSVSGLWAWRTRLADPGVL